MNKYLILGLAVMVFLTGCTLSQTTNDTSSELSESEVEDVFDDFEDSLIDETSDVELGSLI